MIFNLAEQIGATVERHDAASRRPHLTGTPAGVGSARGEFLKPGDTVRSDRQDRDVDQQDR